MNHAIEVPVLRIRERLFAHRDDPHAIINASV
jgi:hypothetical protein